MLSFQLLGCHRSVCWSSWLGGWVGGWGGISHFFCYPTPGWCNWANWNWKSVSAYIFTIYPRTLLAFTLLKTKPKMAFKLVHFCWLTWWFSNGIIHFWRFSSSVYFSTVSILTAMDQVPDWQIILVQFLFPTFPVSTTSFSIPFNSRAPWKPVDCFVVFFLSLSS